MNSCFAKHSFPGSGWQSGEDGAQPLIVHEEMLRQTNACKPALIASPSFHSSGPTGRKVPMHRFKKEDLWCRNAKQQKNYTIKPKLKGAQNTKIKNYYFWLKQYFDGCRFQKKCLTNPFKILKLYERLFFSAQTQAETGTVLSSSLLGGALRDVKEWNRSNQPVR